MNYMASITDFFKSPKWGMNLLLGAVCAIIPIVGPMVLMGWLLAGFWGRSDESAETFPDLNFDKFGKNLERGLWPTLVSLVVGIVIVPVIFIISFAGMAIVGGAASATGGENAGGGSAMMGMLMIGVMVLVLMLAVMFITTPMVFRAALMQDFGAGFNATFVKRFLSLTKMELAISMLFLGAAGVVLMVFTMVPCLGFLLMYAAIPPLYYAWSHLMKQLYKLYLSRGGEALTLSPKLVDAPSEPPASPPDAPAPPAA